MPSHKSKKPRGSAARAAQRAPTVPASGNANTGAARVTATRVAARSMSDSATVSATSAAKSKAANGAGGVVVRRAAVSQAGYRSRMNRAARLRRQRSIIAGTVAAVVVVAGLGILLWNQLPFFHAQASAGPSCTTNARSGPSSTPASPGATPASGGGPSALTGKVVMLDQGLQYIDIKTCRGPAVKAGDKVTVQYTGWLVNGTKFDSSADHPGQPFSFTVGQGQVIPGWDKGLIGMKVGGERRLIIPPALGYGAQGAGSTIPPNATLIFDVTIVSIG